jgi:hypothetical protein
MRTIFKEPLVHFLLLGAAIFGLYALLDDSPPTASKDVIIVSEDDARRLAAEFEATWRRPPKVEELTAIIGASIREEVYVREALALGLDGDDAVIRSRLRLKMEFLMGSGAEVLAPDDATLQAHLDANRDRFTDAPLVAFEQIMLEDGTNPQAATTLLARLQQGEDPAAFGRPTLLPSAISPSSPGQVDNTFGPGFFQALAGFPAGIWAGPVTSSFGTHFVRVTRQIEARTPPLAEIRGAVEQDWRSSFAAALSEDRFQALLSRYQITQPDPAKVLGP